MNNLQEVPSVQAILAKLKAATQEKLLSEAHARACEQRLDDAHKEMSTAIRSYNELVDDLKKALALEVSMGMDDQTFEQVTKV